MSMRCVVIIPARYGSTRLPGKPLVRIQQKPLIQWVYERAAQIQGVDAVMVATDDTRIAEAVQAFGGQAVLTSNAFASGTERVAWVARELEADVVVNLQGDEPLVDVNGVVQAIETVRGDTDAPVATLGCPLREEALWRDPNVVKVVTDRHNRALLFSRSPLPFFRDGSFYPLKGVYQHVGVYVFQADFLQTYVSLPPSPLETVEKLEQLRILWHGYAIQVIPVASCAPGVDTPEDVQKMEKLLTKQ